MATEKRDKSAGGIDPTAISAEDAARLLTAALHRRVDAEVIEKAADAGAPLRSDGTLNLVELAAWLEREVCP